MRYYCKLKEFSLLILAITLLHTGCLPPQGGEIEYVKRPTHASEVEPNASSDAEATPGDPCTTAQASLTFSQDNSNPDILDGEDSALFLDAGHDNDEPVASTETQPSGSQGSKPVDPETQPSGSQGSKPVDPETQPSGSQVSKPVDASASNTPSGTTSVTTPATGTANGQPTTKCKKPDSGTPVPEHQDDGHDH